MSSQDQLTFLEDKVILIISSLGLVLISVVIFWVARQSADRGHVQREEEGEAGLLGGRTRIVPGGREALKAARKEAKKRAKAEFKESSAGLKRRSRVQERKRPVVHVGEEQQHQEDVRMENPIELLRRLENYVLNHKVSSLETLEAELGIPSAEIAVKIQELETRGAFKGIMIDDARGRGESGTSFVRVGYDEMLGLAATINQRGRLTVADFATEANRVLKLSDEGEGEGRSQPADRRTPGCAAGTEAPDDEWSKSSEINKLPACPRSSNGGTIAVVGPSIEAESSGNCQRPMKE